MNGKKAKFLRKAVALATYAQKGEVQIIVAKQMLELAKDNPQRLKGITDLRQAAGVLANLLGEWLLSKDKNLSAEQRMELKEAGYEKGGK